jgi:hypothetical protein
MLFVKERETTITVCLFSLLLVFWVCYIFCLFLEMEKSWTRTMENIVSNLEVNIGLFLSRLEFLLFYFYFILFIYLLLELFFLSLLMLINR